MASAVTPPLEPDPWPAFGSDEPTALGARLVADPQGVTRARGEVPRWR